MVPWFARMRVATVPRAACQINPASAGGFLLQIFQASIQNQAVPCFHNMCPPPISNVKRDPKSKIFPQVPVLALRSSPQCRTAWNCILTWMNSWTFTYGIGMVSGVNIPYMECVGVLWWLKLTWFRLEDWKTVGDVRRRWSPQKRIPSSERDVFWKGARQHPNNMTQSGCNGCWITLNSPLLCDYCCCGVSA